jgi:hypothetical protein
MAIANQKTSTNNCCYSIGVGSVNTSDRGSKRLEVTFG